MTKPARPTASGTNESLEDFALYLYAESPVRAGGDDDDRVDLPLQRDGVTGWPVVHGQSLKGALRQHLVRIYGEKNPAVVDLFGGPTDDATAGRIVLSEAHVVALPVPTSIRIFGWVTCPLALEKVERVRALAGLAPLDLAAMRRPALSRAAVSCDPAIAARNHVIGPVVVGIEDVTADPGKSVRTALESWAKTIGDEALSGRTFDYFREKFAQDVLLCGDELGGLLLQLAPIEVTRNRIEGNKTVPFDDESLPEESLLVARLTLPVAHVPLFISHVDGQVVRIGADRSVGKGMMWCRLAAGQATVPTAGESQ